MFVGFRRSMVNSETVFEPAYTTWVFVDKCRAVRRGLTLTVASNLFLAETCTEP